MERPKYWGTDKGVIVGLIARGIAEFWNELKMETGFDNEKLNFLLSELYETGDLYKNDYGAYRVIYELYQSYINQFDSEHILRTREEPNLVEKIKSWISVQEIEASLDTGHFFLDGRHLDQFTKFILDRANKEIIAVNPFVDECDLSKELGESQKRGVNVQLLTRHPDEGKIKCHGRLKKEGVKLYYDNIHAKLILVDNGVAIVSSMNFISESSAGKTWEAGIVTVDKTIIESMRKKILEQMKSPAK